MRPVVYSFVRGVTVVSLTVALSAPLAAARRDTRDRPPVKRTPIVKIIVKFIHSLGDGLIVPMP
jgi:hypothetical protein